MKKPLAITGILLAACFSFSSFAQERVIIEDGGSSRKSYYKKKERNKPIRNFLNSYVEDPLNETSLKFNPLQIFMGEIGIIGEQALTDRCSGVFSIGPTISSLSPVSQGHYFPQSTSFNQPVMSTQSKAGIMVGTAFRYYPMDNDRVMNGFYIEPAFKIRTFNEGLIDREGILDPTEGGSAEYRFAFNLGSQRWYSNRFSIGYYMGVGIVSEKESTSRVFAEYDQNSGNVQYSWQESTIKDSRWFLSGGITVGIGWSK
jgi:hypothetical protein